MRMGAQDNKGWQSLAPPQQNARSGLRTCGGQPQSGLRVVAKIDHSIGKTALIQEIQHGAYVLGRTRAPGPSMVGTTSRMILVNEPVRILGGEGRTRHRNIERRLSLQLANRLRCTRLVGSDRDGRRSDYNICEAAARLI